MLAKVIFLTAALPAVNAFSFKISMESQSRKTIITSDQRRLPRSSTATASTLAAAYLATMLAGPMVALGDETSAGFEEVRQKLGVP